MINKLLLPKAYREVVEIIKFIPQSEYQKIPIDYIEKMQRYMDKDYNYEVVNFNNLEEQEMLYETEIILAFLYRKYWATENQKEIILPNEIAFRNKQEENKRQKYNPDDIFKKRKKVKQEYLEQNEEKSIAVMPKEKWYKNIFNKIKELSKRK